MVRARGFTLIELVVVILLLGVMATFTSQFISTGTQLYADASAREQLMSDVRFGVERLNREVRDAVPGTLSLSSDGQCVSFWPLAAVSRYVSLPLSASGSLTFLSPMSGVVQAAVLVRVRARDRRGAQHQPRYDGSCELHPWLLSFRMMYNAPKLLPASTSKLNVPGSGIA